MAEIPISIKKIAGMKFENSDYCFLKIIKNVVDLWFSKNKQESLEIVYSQETGSVSTNYRILWEHIINYEIFLK